LYRWNSKFILYHWYYRFALLSCGFLCYFADLWFFLWYRFLCAKYSLIMHLKRLSACCIKDRFFSSYSPCFNTLLQDNFFYILLLISISFWFIAWKKWKQKQEKNFFLSCLVAQIQSIPFSDVYSSMIDLFIDLTLKTKLLKVLNLKC